ncbi:MAG TPA: hypothetical protein VGM82_23495 [Gemmatimonadaceae bacterium]|jgi:hypothetical protein
MNRPSAPRAPTRTLAQHEDTQDLESVISKSLAVRPIDVSMLRRGVWTYVREEHQAGTSPGKVILTLTELIEKSKSTSEMEQQAVMRRVILWCVEAYFGQLGDQTLGAMPPDPTLLAESTVAQL